MTGCRYSFRFGYRVCYDTETTELAKEFGGGSADPIVTARTFSNRTFDKAASERAGFDVCILAFSDRG
jgi:hypothetical protein